MSEEQSVSVPTLRVVTASEAAELPTLDPFYNIHCDLLPGPQQTAFEDQKRSSKADWYKSFADLGVKHIGDTPFAVIALRDGNVVGWLRFYPAGKCNVRARVKKQPPAGTALVVCAAAVNEDELPHGTARRMIEKAIERCRRLGLSEVYAVASPDIRAYAAWSNKLMLKDYTACGFEVVEKTPADPGALRDMANGAHGKDAQESVREDGITDTYAADYCLVRRKCE